MSGFRCGSAVVIVRAAPRVFLLNQGGIGNRLQQRRPSSQDGECLSGFLQI